MKYTIEKGRYRNSMYLFIFTGLFLIGLFSYQLNDLVNERPFQSDFPGDWDKVLGIAIGIFLIIRSFKFRVQSRDLFIQFDDNSIQFRIDRNDKVHKIDKSIIQDIKVQKGNLKISKKDNPDSLTINLNDLRMRDELKNKIVKAFNQFL